MSQTKPAIYNAGQTHWLNVNNWNTNFDSSLKYITRYYGKYIILLGIFLEEIALKVPTLTLNEHVQNFILILEKNLKDNCSFILKHL